MNYPTKILYRPPTEALRFLPEGPYPLGDARISWVAIQHGADATQGSLNILDLRTGQNETYDLPGRPGFAFPCSDGESFVVGCERSLGVFHPATKQWRVFCDGIDRDVSGTIINDGVVWENCMVFGCKDLEFQEAKAGLYLWHGGKQKLFKLRNDQTCSNGKAIRLTASGSLELVDIDTPTKQVAAYTLDLESGTLGPRRVLVELKNHVGFPDGAILTPDGSGIIISIYNPDAAPHGETRVYDLQSGKVLDVWETAGSPQATCPQLVELDGQIKLVITTAVEHMPSDRRASAPNAGCLFIGDTPFRTASSAPRFFLPS
jgi:sugar lactone lactonase YvrE